MDGLFDSIICFLATHPNTMAKKIASTLGVPRQEVNSLLYSYRGSKFQINEKYEWILIPEKHNDILLKKKKKYIVFRDQCYKLYISETPPKDSDCDLYLEITDESNYQYVIFQIKEEIHIMSTHKLLSNYKDTMFMIESKKTNKNDQVRFATFANTSDWLIVYFSNKVLFRTKSYFIKIIKLSDFFSADDNYDISLLIGGNLEYFKVIEDTNTFNLKPYALDYINDWGIAISQDNYHVCKYLESIILEKSNHMLDCLRIDEPSPTKPTTSKGHKFGYMGRSFETDEFYVVYEDTRIIGAPTAAEVLVDVINELSERIPIQRIAQLPIIVDTMPFISPNHYQVGKSSLHQLKNGWWVNTHMSNESKKEILEKIARNFGCKIKVVLKMNKKK